MTDETDGLNISIQELIPPKIGERLWKVVAGRRAVTFQVTVTCDALKETPSGSKSLGRLWSDGEIAKGVRLAVERALFSPPRKERGTTYPIELTSHDFYEANGRL